MLKTSIAVRDDLTHFNYNAFNEHTRIIKLYGRKFYFSLLNFMNQGISTGQKYLPEKYSFKASRA